MRSRFSPVVFAALVVCSLFACSGSSESQPSREDCEQVRDHVVALRVDAAQLPDGDHELASIELGKHRAALSSSLGEQYIDQCRDNTPAYVECVLKATSTRDSAACATR